MGFLASPAFLAGRWHPEEFSTGSLPTSTLTAPKFCLTRPGTVLRGPSQSLVHSARAWSWVPPVSVERMAHLV